MTSQNNEQTISTKKIRQYCYALAEQLNDFRPHLNAVFTISGVQDNKDTLLELQSEILRLASGQKLHNKLKRHLDINNARTAIIGIVAEDKKKMMGLISKKHYTALININAKDIEDHIFLKTIIYGQLWQYMSIISDIESQFEKYYGEQDGVISQRWNDRETARRNMLADVFGSSLIQIDESKTAIMDVATIRTEDSFEKLVDYDAASQPFPAIVEATELVFRDIVSTSRPKEEKLQIGLNIIDEIHHSIDENVVIQWQNFIEPARDMAWAGVSTSLILGAAVFTSDNVYNRSLAQLISETLNIGAAPIIEFDGYNAYADADSQRRAHKMACLETFEYAFLSSIAQEKAATYIDFAEQSCQMLLKAKPCGWCAPALFEVAKALNASPDTDKETLANIFSNEINAIDWSIIRTLNKNLIERKSKGMACNFNSIIDMLRQEDETRQAAITVKSLQNLIAIKKAANPLQPFVWEDVTD